MADILIVEDNPDIVANLYAFLASDEARAINGMELRVDSGQFVMSV